MCVQKRRDETAFLAGLLEKGKLACKFQRRWLINNKAIVLDHLVSLSNILVLRMINKEGNSEVNFVHKTTG